MAPLPFDPLLMAWQRLDVSHNKLRELPNTIGTMTSLVTLRLQCNQLETLPDILVPDNDSCNDIDRVRGMAKQREAQRKALEAATAAKDKAIDDSEALLRTEKQPGGGLVSGVQSPRSTATSASTRDGTSGQVPSANAAADARPAAAAGTQDGAGTSAAVGAGAGDGDSVGAGGGSSGQPSPGVRGSGDSGGGDANATASSPGVRAAANTGAGAGAGTGAGSGDGGAAGAGGAGGGSTNATASSPLASQAGSVVEPLGSHRSSLSSQSVHSIDLEDSTDSEDSVDTQASECVRLCGCVAAWREGACRQLNHAAHTVVVTPPPPRPPRVACSYLRNKESELRAHMEKRGKHVHRQLITQLKAKRLRGRPDIAAVIRKKARARKRKKGAPKLTGFTPFGDPHAVEPTGLDPVAETGGGSDSGAESESSIDSVERERRRLQNVKLGVDRWYDVHEYRARPSTPPPRPLRIRVGYCLESLTDLNLSQNKLITLPNWLSGVTALKRLDVTWNQLESVPTSVGGFPSLMELRLSRNDMAFHGLMQVGGWALAAVCVCVCVSVGVCVSVCACGGCTWPVCGWLHQRARCCVHSPRGSGCPRLRQGRALADARSFQAAEDARRVTMWHARHAQGIGAAQRVSRLVLEPSHVASRVPRLPYLTGCCGRPAHQGSHAELGVEHHAEPPRCDRRPAQARDAERRQQRTR